MNGLSLGALQHRRKEGARHAAISKFEEINLRLGLSRVTDPDGSRQPQQRRRAPRFRRSSTQVLQRRSQVSKMFPTMERMPGRLPVLRILAARTRSSRRTSPLGQLRSMPIRRSIRVRRSPLTEPTFGLPTRPMDQFLDARHSVLRSTTLHRERFLTSPTMELERSLTPQPPYHPTGQTSGSTTPDPLGDLSARSTSPRVKQPPSVISRLARTIQHMRFERFRRTEPTSGSPQILCLARQVTVPTGALSKSTLRQERWR